MQASPSVSRPTRQRRDHLHARRGRRCQGRGGDRRRGGKAVAIQADAADAEAVRAAVAQTVATFGALDVLVNNAGTAIPKPFEETTLEEMDRMMDINVPRRVHRHARRARASAQRRSHHQYRLLCRRAHDDARPCRLCRDQGRREDVHAGPGPRSGCARHHGQQHPAGPDRHDLNPAAGDWADPQIAATALKRYGHVDDIAAMVAFVAGPEAGYITGASLTVDGGTNA